MSRYHPRGRRSQWQTLRAFYPAVDLLRSYRNGHLDFDELAAAYTNTLDDAYHNDSELADWVAASPALGNFTLLCYEREGEACHRLVLARWLKEKQPRLDLADPLK